MAKRTRVVIGGVDTHGRTHHAAVIDQHGRRCQACFPGARVTLTFCWLLPASGGR
jgi:hypothetical protein